MNFFVSEHRLFNRKGQDIGRDPPLITPTEKPKINPLKCIQMITCNHALRISGVDRTGSGTKRGIASEALSWLKYRSGASSKTGKEDTAKKYFIHIYVTKRQVLKLHTRQALKLHTIQAIKLHTIHRDAAVRRNRQESDE